MNDRCDARTQSELMLVKAMEDRAALQFPLPASVYGFHAQQAVEKLLKCLIAARNLRYPFTHDLRSLWSVCEEAGESMPHLPLLLINLQDFAVTMRYDYTDPLTEDDRAKMRDAVDEFELFVRGRVEQLQARD